MIGLSDFWGGVFVGSVGMFVAIVGGAVAWFGVCSMGDREAETRPVEPPSICYDDSERVSA